jgi:hypothetical protein
VALGVLEHREWGLLVRGAASYVRHRIVRSHQQRLFQSLTALLAAAGGHPRGERHAWARRPLGARRPPLLVIVKENLADVVVARRADDGSAAGRDRARRRRRRRQARWRARRRRVLRRGLLVVHADHRRRRAAALRRRRLLLHERAPLAGARRRVGGERVEAALDGAVVVRRNGRAEVAPEREAVVDRPLVERGPRHELWHCNRTVGRSCGRRPRGRRRWSYERTRRGTAPEGVRRGGRAVDAVLPGGHAISQTVSRAKLGPQPWLRQNGVLAARRRWSRKRPRWGVPGDRIRDMIDGYGMRDGTGRREEREEKRGAGRGAAAHAPARARARVANERALLQDAHAVRVRAHLRALGAAVLRGARM